MDVCRLQQVAAQLEARLMQVDFEKLPVSDYNKRFVARLKLALGYYMEIYATCFRHGFERLGNVDPSEVTLVDFGGGSGFVSLMARMLGVKEVIYVDLNPKSVHLVRVLSEVLGFGPDVVLEGSSDVLLDWCRRENRHPQLLVATDLIEHVYDLDVLFADLTQLSPELVMVFTTGSTPDNPRMKRRLHKLMQGCESGSLEQPNYLEMRRRFLRETYPDLSSEETERLARLTRGLVYADIRKAVDSGCIPPLRDAYNTCDPSTGNWKERILPVCDYRRLAGRYGFRLEVLKGFYHVRRRNRLASWVARLANRLIRITGKAGFRLAPFILLLYIKKKC